MNRKEEYLMSIVAATVEVCSMTVDGEKILTKEELLGESRRPNALMARSMMATTILRCGFSKETIARLLKRSERGVCGILKNAIEWHRSSRAYRIAEKELEDECDKLFCS